MLLRQLRDDAGLSQTALADQAGVSKRWLVNFENGKPSVDMSMVMDCFSVFGVGFELARVDGQ
ncbi:helix-turn-helix domain-containing protein [Arthrobacter sp. H5]|uniref:helix-turn-helix domain-containing protein n=1 Tax=Arthrobacter sp. H5 TaxID=1267973 RepID=UPI0004B89715|nr:helix-turn-helix domain-containing protein [Arthrobacter sp. H5]